MAKRFIDTSIFRKDFIRGLDAPCKLLFLYLINECDHAGLWDVELEVAEVRLGLKFKGDPINQFAGKVIPVDGGKKWFIPSFVNFQYGDLNPENRAHGSVISLLKKFDLLDSEHQIKPLISPLQGAMDMDMVKDTDMVKVKAPETEKFNPFDFIPGTWDRTEFMECWTAHMDVRRKKKNPASPKACELMLKELVRVCPVWSDARGKMEAAIISGWPKYIYDGPSTKKTEPEGGRYAHERVTIFDKA